MNFKDCEICGSGEWEKVYSGPIRDGIFGKYVQEAVVGRCTGCGVERLAENFCTPDSYYQTSEYREKLQNGLDSDSYFTSHDELQIHTQRVIWPQNLRHATIADIGCGGGALLDHMKGWTNRQVAIEPYDIYREGLKSRGYSVYPYATDAIGDWEGKVDYAFSIQVIEHTSNPRLFLEQIRPLLSSDGQLVISTPNLNDILFKLLPEEFPSFFYRVVHRWYFDVSSLTACAKMAGFDVDEVKYVHRYNMANTLRWLRDRSPTGNAKLNGITPQVDAFWGGYLESQGLSDCLYMILRPSSK